VLNVNSLDHEDRKAKGEPEIERRQRWEGRYGLDSKVYASMFQDKEGAGQ
jgi:hypothetical protein